MDLEDVDEVMDANWSKNGKGYASGWIPNLKRTELMHRYILKAKKGQVVDHINGNTLDNRRCNLRFATQSQNMTNRAKSSHNKCGFKGVYWRKDKKYYVIDISNHSKRISRGTFACKYDAATAYNFYAHELHGEFVNYNTVPQPWLEEVGTA